ncbi:MAG: hypothetical protein DWI22_15420 [Planctomycetota bacterium]|nr:MAG: hypothetical protein DWI22_15420 [Planctomycetota bacterium]
MFTQFSSEHVAWLLHQRVTVTAALDHARLQPSRTIPDSTFGDPFQKVIALLPQCLPRHQPARMHGPAGENELTGTRETDRSRFLFAANGAIICRSSADSPVSLPYVWTRGISVEFGVALMGSKLHWIPSFR